MRNAPRCRHHATTMLPALPPHTCEKGVPAGAPFFVAKGCRAISAAAYLLFLLRSVVPARGFSPGRASGPTSSCAV